MTTSVELKTEIVKLLFQTEDVRLLRKVNDYFRGLLKKDPVEWDLSDEEMLAMSKDLSMSALHKIWDNEEDEIWNEYLKTEPTQ
jgi:hypothetical protein